MISYLGKQKQKVAYKAISCIVAIAFSASMIMPPQAAYAQTMLSLPLPGTMIPLSPAFSPVVIKGLKVHPDNPFEFDFIIDKGQARIEGPALKEEANKLVKYFLASLTVPEEDLWVNLSPFEKDRIIPEEFGLTEMGRDMLSQDYLLKQLTASLIYPENELGKKFWDRVYKKAYDMFGTTEVPVNTFNKVWIMPDEAEINEINDMAFIVKSRLKVMLEEDYVALRNEESNAESRVTQAGLGIASSETNLQVSTLSSDVVRQIIIPEIEKEVNEGKNFAQLRQIFNSLILAAWYKRSLKESVLGQIYVDKKKVSGIDVEDKEIKQEIYEKYLEAYKQGVYNYIKDDYDKYSEEMIPRKYFSGGVEWRVDEAMMVDKVPKKSWGRRLSGILGGLAIVLASTVLEGCVGGACGTIEPTKPKIIRTEDTETKVRRILEEMKFEESQSASVLESLGKPEIPYLLEELKNLGRSSRWRAIKLLTNLGPVFGNDPKLIKQLTVAYFSSIEIKKEEGSKFTTISGNPSGFEQASRLFKSKAIRESGVIPYLLKEADIKDSPKGEMAIEFLGYLLSNWSRGEPGVLQDGDSILKAYHMPFLKEYIKTKVKTSVETQDDDSYFTDILLKLTRITERYLPDTPLRRYFANMAYRHSEVKQGLYTLEEMESIYFHDKFQQETKARDMNSANQFSVAKSVTFLLKRFGREVDSQNIDKVLPFILAVHEDFAAIDFLDKSKNFIPIVFKDPKQFAVKPVLEVAQALGVKNIQSALVGKETKNDVIRSVVESPSNAFFYFEGHANETHFALSPKDKDAPKEEFLHKSDSLSYEEIADAIIQRAQRNNGDLSKDVFLFSACLTGHFIRRIQNSVYQKAAHLGLITKSPLFFSPSGEDTSTILTGGIFFDALGEKPKSLFTMNLKVIAEKARQEYGDKARISLLDVFGLEQKLRAFQDTVASVPLSEERQKQYGALKEALGVKPTSGDKPLTIPLTTKIGEFELLHPDIPSLIVDADGVGDLSQIREAQDILEEYKATGDKAMLGSLRAKLTSIFGAAFVLSLPFLLRSDSVQEPSKIDLSSEWPGIEAPKKPLTPERKPFNIATVINENDFSIKISRKVLEQLEKTSSPQTENSNYLYLNTKTGVIDKISSRYLSSGPHSASMDPGVAGYFDEVARKHGYLHIGHFHAHPNTYAIKTEEIPEEGVYSGMGNNLLTSDDIPSIMPSDQFRLLGVGFDGKFEAIPYVVLGNLPEGHPYKDRKKEFEQRKMFPTSVVTKDKQPGIIKLNIEVVDTEENPLLGEILDQHPPFIEETRQEFSHDAYSELILGLKKVAYGDQEIRSAGKKVYELEKKNEELSKLPFEEGFNKENREKRIALYQEIRALNKVVFAPEHDHFDHNDPNLLGRVIVEDRKDGEVIIRGLSNHPDISKSRDFIIKHDTKKDTVSIYVYVGYESGSYRLEGEAIRYLKQWAETNKERIEKEVHDAITKLPDNAMLTTNEEMGKYLLSLQSTPLNLDSSDSFLGKLNIYDSRDEVVNAIVLLIALLDPQQSESLQILSREKIDSDEKVEVVLQKAAEAQGLLSQDPKAVLDTGNLYELIQKARLAKIIDHHRYKDLRKSIDGMVFFLGGRIYDRAMLTTFETSIRNELLSLENIGKGDPDRLRKEIRSKFPSRKNTAVINALIKFLEIDTHSDDRLVREAAAAVLGSYGAAAASAVPVLMRAFDDPNNYVQTSAMWAFQQIGVKDPEAIGVLARIVREGHTRVRSDAARTLSMFGRDAISTLSELLEALNHPNSFVVQEAARTLGFVLIDMGRSPESLDDEHREHVESVVNKLIRILNNHPQPACVSEAAMALARIGHADAVKPLETRRAHPHSDVVRKTSDIALTWLANPALIMRDSAMMTEGIRTIENMPYFEKLDYQGRTESDYVTKFGDGQNDWYLKVNREEPVRRELMGYFWANLLGVNTPKISTDISMEQARAHGSESFQGYINATTRGLKHHWGPNIKLQALLIEDVEGFTKDDLVQKETSGIEEALVFLAWTGYGDIDFESDFNVKTKEVDGKKRALLYDFVLAGYAGLAVVAGQPHGLRNGMSFAFDNDMEISVERLDQAIRKIENFTGEEFLKVVRRLGFKEDQFDLEKVMERKAKLRTIVSDELSWTADHYYGDDYEKIQRMAEYIYEQSEEGGDTAMLTDSVIGNFSSEELEALFLDVRDRLPIASGPDKMQEWSDELQGFLDGGNEEAKQVLNLPEMRIIFSDLSELLREVSFVKEIDGKMYFWVIRHVDTDNPFETRDGLKANAFTVRDEDGATIDVYVNNDIGGLIREMVREFILPNMSGFSQEQRQLVAFLAEIAATGHPIFDAEEEDNLVAILPTRVTDRIIPETSLDQLSAFVAKGKDDFAQKVEQMFPSDSGLSKTYGEIATAVVKGFVTLAKQEMIARTFQERLRKAIKLEMPVPGPADSSGEEAVFIEGDDVLPGSRLSDGKDNKTFGDVTYGFKKSLRSSQQDRHLNTSVNLPGVPNGNGYLMSVMDGHGSDTEVDGKKMHSVDIVRDNLENDFLNAMKKNNGDVKAALNQTIADLDGKMKEVKKGGTTISIVYVPSSKEKAYVAVLGDSPVIIKDKEGDLFVSEDHNVDNPAEKELARQRGAEFVTRGGHPYMVPKDNPNVAPIMLTRALGDENFGKVISKVPDIYEIGLGRESFIVLGSDGIWAPNRYGEHQLQLRDITGVIEVGLEAKDLVESIVDDIGGTDNVTAVLLKVLDVAMMVTDMIKRRSAQVVNDFNRQTMGFKVVDLGSGNGEFLSRYRAQNSEHTIIGFDGGAATIRKLQDAQLVPLDGLAFVNPRRTGLNDESVDRVTINLPNLRGMGAFYKLLDEAKRILKPGGELIVVSREAGIGTTLVDRGFDKSGHFRTMLDSDSPYPMTTRTKKNLRNNTFLYRAVKPDKAMLTGNTVKLQNGAKLWTQKDAEKMAEVLPGLEEQGYVDENDQGGLEAKTPSLINLFWRSSLENSSKDLDADLLEEIIQKAAVAKEQGRMLTVLDWGCGSADTLNDIARKLSDLEPGIDNVQLVGLSNQYSENWNNLHPGVNIIFDNAENIDKYLAEGSVDFIFSLFGLFHLKNDAEPENSKFATYLNGKIHALMRPDAEIVFNLDKFRAGRHIEALNGFTVMYDGQKKSTGLEVNFRVRKDAAMLTDEKPVGGIDFNPANLNLKINHDENGKPLPLTPQQIENINLDGLTPVIINIMPITDIPMLLGEAAEEENMELSSL